MEQFRARNVATAIFTWVAEVLMVNPMGQAICGDTRKFAEQKMGFVQAHFNRTQTCHMVCFSHWRVLKRYADFHFKQLIQLQTLHNDFLWYYVFCKLHYIDHQMFLFFEVSSSLISMEAFRPLKWDCHFMMITILKIKCFLTFFSFSSPPLL